MGPSYFLKFHLVLPCCLAVVLVVHFQQAAGSGAARQQRVHLENPTLPGGKRRRYAPPELPAARRNAALQLFEEVHPTLTIHYGGFSRQGSVICYDMLNEVRTVDEARALMDVEFHLLDLMLEHYKVSTHMRIVDAQVVKNMLNIGNLFSFRFPEVVRNVTAFIKSYDPLLRLFLKRYLAHTERIVIVNVPSFLAPMVPTLVARIMGVPASKLAAITSGGGLEQFMERKYIPREFGNPSGFSVKNNDENTTANCLMLQEIKLWLGESALSAEGRQLLDLQGPRLLSFKRREPSSSQTTVSAVSTTTMELETASRGIDAETPDADDIEGEPFDDIE